MINIIKKNLKIAHWLWIKKPKRIINSYLFFYKNLQFEDSRSKNGENKWFRRIDR
jgi:hypothetical protein